MAIMRLLADTGMRVGELAGIKVEDLDLEYSMIVVLGKNRRPRLCPFGRKTSLAIDRYLRLRAQREDAHLEALWIGSGGPMTANGIADMVRRRGKKARVQHVHPHRFRHTFAHRWLAAGGAEIDLMQLAGWHSRAMVGRYGASAASEPSPAPSSRIPSVFKGFRPQANARGRLLRAGDGVRTDN